MGRAWEGGEGEVWRARWIGTTDTAQHNTYFTHAPHTGHTHANTPHRAFSSDVGRRRGTP